QKEAVLASRYAIVTVEEVVDDLGDTAMNETILPGWTINAVCEVPRGAHPSYAHGFYERHNAFYTRWDPIARDREAFLNWMEEYVLSCATFADTWNKLEADGYV
ncbi:MAG: hypothetical protein OXD42_07810, partial [Rhodospirillaceae bacterium]|nr:hypothetical protein [Rhodospirillaceae bacterium]